MKSCVFLFCACPKCPKNRCASSLVSGPLQLTGPCSVGNEWLMETPLDPFPQSLLIKPESPVMTHFTLAVVDYDSQVVG